MTQARVNELENVVRGDIPNDQVYLGNQGLRVGIYNGPNKWSQVIAPKPDHKTIAASGNKRKKPSTSIELGRTKRISFRNAKEIGNTFKKWAREHTNQECQDAAKMFREYAKTDVEGRRAGLKVLRDALDRAISLTDSSQEKTPRDAQIAADQYNRILYGPPGTGKTFDAVSEAVMVIDGNLPKARASTRARFDKLRTEEQVEFVTFHQNYAYEDFIEGIRPVLDQKRLRYDLRDGIFKQIAKRARRDPGNRYVLIIDEINRGNIAKIFGELITLIEPSKRVGGEDEARATLPYSQEPFNVPANLYLIGTMNTADRGIALLDVALRRRFDFVERMPNPDHGGISEDIEGVNGRALLRAINGRIVERLDREHQIGHTYLMGIQTLEALKRAFQNRVVPLLQEYFYDKLEEMRGVLNENAFITRREGTERPVFDVLSPDDGRWLDATEYEAIYSNSGAADDE